MKPEATQEPKCAMAFEETIAAPPERVFAALTNVEAMREWMPGFAGVELVTPGPFGKGTQFRESRKMMGHTATELFEVTVHEPPRTLEYFIDGTKGSSKCGWYRFRYELTPKDGGTLMSVSGQIGGTTGCMSVFGKLMLGPMKKAIAKDHAALKAWIERQGDASSA
jgi:carbon monoxide dehydrogenase subunit G